MINFLLSTVKFVWKGLKSRKLCIYFQIVPCLQDKTCYELIMINYTVSLLFLTGPKEDMYWRLLVVHDVDSTKRARPTYEREREREFMNTFWHILLDTCWQWLGKACRFLSRRLGRWVGGNLKMGCWLWQRTFWGMINLSSIVSLRVNVYWM